jgi:hypothetical protein
MTKTLTDTERNAARRLRRARERALRYYRRNRDEINQRRREEYAQDKEVVRKAEESEQSTEG